MLLLVNNKSNILLISTLQRRATAAVILRFVYPVDREIHQRTTRGRVH